MLLHQETWMNIRAFKKLRSEGANYVDIARETGCDWRTVKKYLAEDAPVAPPVVKGRTTRRGSLSPTPPSLTSGSRESPSSRAP